MSAPSTQRTPSAASRNPSDYKSSFTPVQRLAAEHQMKVLAIAVAIIVPVVCLWIMSGMMSKAREPQQVFAIDGAGVLHIGPLEKINRESALFRELVLQIVQAHFTRNPGGLSYGELAARLYSSEAVSTLKKEVAIEADLFSLRNYYQQVEVTAIEPLDWEGAKPRYRAKGFIIRSGVIDGLSTRDGPYYFRISYELVQNPDLGAKGQYPYKVGRYKLTWTNGSYEPLSGDDSAMPPGP